MTKVRTTLSLDAEAMKRWQAVADNERRSLSAVVTGWLEQVIEPAEFVAGLAASERAAGVKNVKLIISSLQQAQEQSLEAILRARGRPDLVPSAIEASRAQERETLDRVARAGAKAGPRSRHAAADAHDLVPPSCNTGGKLPIKAERKQRRNP